MTDSVQINPLERAPGVSGAHSSFILNAPVTFHGSHHGMRGTRHASVVRLLLLILFACVAVPVSAGQAARPCRVLDPDLQECYRGECRDGWAHGRGEASGRADYAGEFSHGRKQGRGRLRLANGDIYTGAFRDDQPHGPGTYLWQSDAAQRGNHYVGEFRAGKRDGFGVLLTATGDRYEGQWHDDVRAGQTATEIQFQRQYQALSQTIEAGAIVCRRYPQGIGGEQDVKGSVVEKHGGLLTIRPERPRGTQVDPAQALPALLVDEGIMAWRPCL